MAPAAEVVFAQGLVSAQRGSEPARFLGQGNQLFEGDLVRTGRKGFAILQFSDGGRMTLRPDTSLNIERYVHGEQEGSALLELLKGGLRAVTGLIAKRDPAGMKVRTSVATIGIRGTEFDARLCETDCGEEAKTMRGAVRAGSPVVARVALLTGSLGAEDAKGVTRRLVTGGPIYPGDTLQTGLSGFAVIAFRDESRVTLGADTRFKVEDFRYEPQASGIGGAVLRLVQGRMRAVTGLLARRNPASVRYETIVATIGIRGTGLDVWCIGRCAAGNRAPAASGTPQRADDGLFVHAWQGTLEMRHDGRVQQIDEGRTAFLASGATDSVLLPALPAFIGENTDPRPDQVPIDLHNLFGATERDPAMPGLYVLVHDGHVTLEQAGRLLELGGGESGYADPAGRLLERLVALPIFLDMDRFPRPSQFDERVRRIIELIREERSGAGRDLECEVR